MKEIELTKQLMKISSVSGNEQKIGEFLYRNLSKNFFVKKQFVGNRFNLFAYVGDPKLILTTHIDTVPGKLKIKEDAKWLYGRGSCDSKASIASMICAAEDAIELGISNFGLVFDVSEETDFSGIKKAIKLVKPKIVIVGEPTKLNVIQMQKGLLGFTITCKGKSAHGSTPEKGKSAINSLIDQLSILKKLKFPKDKICGSTTLNIGVIRGGVSSNVVADLAEADIEIRTIKNNGEIVKMIRKEIPNLKIRINCSFEPVRTKNSEFIKSLKYKKTSVPYFTEMYFWSQKCEAIVFGPGNVKYAHADNERILKKEILSARKAYLDMIIKANKLFMNGKVYKE